MKIVDYHCHFGECRDPDTDELYEIRIRIIYYLRFTDNHI